MLIDINYSSHYDRAKKDKIESYIGEFTRDQIEKGISKIEHSISSIIISYHREKQSSLECLQAIPFIKRNIFEAKDEEISKLRNNSGQYEMLRQLINKNDTRIRRVLRYARIPFPEDNKERYLEVLSDLTKDCLEVSLEKFKEEIEKLKEEEKEQKFQKIIDERLEVAASNRQKLIDDSQYKKADRKSFIERFGGSKKRKALKDIGNIDKQDDSIASRLKKRKLSPIKHEVSKEKESESKVKWAPDNKTNIVDNIKDFNRQNTFKRSQDNNKQVR